MPAPTNLSFEIVGTEPGFAASWSGSVSTAMRTESFARADGGESSFDGFEFGWGCDAFVGDLVVPTNEQTMQFGPIPTTAFDGFEHHWNNDGFLFDLAVTVAAAYASFPGAPLPHPTTEAFESFEHQWLGNDAFAFDISGVALATDQWNSTLDAVEAFEREWGANESFLFDLGSIATMQFNEAGVLGGAETFESFIVDKPFTIDGSTIVCPGHGFSNGNNVKFFPSLFGASVLPSPISTKLTYQVASATANTFTLTVNGLGITLADAGSGQNWVRADPTISWGGLDGDTQGEDP